MVLVASAADEGKVLGWGIGIHIARYRAMVFSYARWIGSIWKGWWHCCETPCAEGSERHEHRGFFRTLKEETSQNVSAVVTCNGKG